jgi:regulator of sigma E protease
MGSRLLAFLLMMGPLITVHELGHFLIAKWSGVRVLVFSLGFGPRLFGIRIGDTDYRVSAFPLGGYVRMFGDDLTTSLPADEQRFGYLYQPVWRKMSIAFGGPLFNGLLAWAALSFLALGTHEVLLPVVGAVLPGTAAAQAGLVAGDKIVEIDGVPVSRFAEMRAAIGSHVDTEASLVVERDGQRVPVVVRPTAVAGDVVVEGPRGSLGITPSKPVPLLFVMEPSLAFTAGLRTGDRVLAVDDIATTTPTMLWTALASERALSLRVARDGAEVNIALPPSTVAGDIVPMVDRRAFAVVAAEQAALAVRMDDAAKAMTEHVGRVRQQRGIDSLEGLVVRVDEEGPAAVLGLMAKRARVLMVDGQPLTFAGQMDGWLQAAPNDIHVFGVQHDDGRVAVLVTRLAPSTRKEDMGRKTFGAWLGTSHADPATTTVSTTLPSAIVEGARETGAMLAMMVKGIAWLITGRVGADQVGGPMAMATMANDAASDGWRTFLQLMALLSVNLALLNMMPIPVLDGGHILMFAIEAVRGEPLQLKARMGLMKVGVLLVGLLMALALFNDFVR